MQVAVEPTSILIADDSATVRRYIERSLYGMGRVFDITFAHDGKDAVEKLMQRHFDIAFLDIMMPQVDGIEVMGAIKMRNGSTFAIAMSDGLSERAETLLKSFGAYDFLTKPFTEAAVRGVIESFDVIKRESHVLIVDDSTTVRNVVKKVLSRSIFNLHLSEAPDGPSALKAASEQAFRIIFSDVNMPGMSGVELAAALAPLRRAPDVILMSTEMTRDVTEAASNVGARAFLKKPFYPTDVDTILHHLFGLRHSRFGAAVKLFASI